MLTDIRGHHLDTARPWTRARFLLLRGRIEAEAGESEKAEGSLLDAVTTSDATDSDGLKGDCYSALAIASQWRGRYGEASRLYAKGATCYWRIGDKHALAGVLLNRGWTLNVIGDLTGSMDCFRSAHEAAQTARRGETELRAQLGIAWVEARSGQTGSSRRKLLAAWRHARRLRAPREEALALEYLAEADVLAGRLTQARVAVRLCARLAQRLAPEGDIALEASIRRAQLTLAEGRAAEAAAEARAAVGHAQRIGMPWEEAQAWRVHGVACIEAGRKASARKAFRRAHGLLQAMGEQLERRVVEAWIDALARPDAGGYLQAPRRARPGGGDAADAQAAALEYWLNHPLLGPRAYLQRKNERQRKRAFAVRYGPEKGGRAVLLPAAPPRRDWTRETIRLSPGAPSEASEAQVSPLWAELGLVTRTAAVRDVLRLAETYAPGEIPVLLLGETGTGKDLLAQGLHALSGRRGRYVPVNCAALRAELLVAELFGVRRGAYTGAVEDRCGLIEEAAGGTLFFDEIADLGSESQGYLLRFLDSGEIRAVGDTRSRKVETRVLAATCQDLAELVAAGRFRGDLYGRLAGLVLDLPPLRERRADLGILVEMLWQRGGGDAADCSEVFTPELHAALRELRWSMNVRGLRHLVDRTLLLSRRYGAAAARTAVLKDAADCELPRTQGPRRKRPIDPAHARQGEWDADLLRDALEVSGGVIPEAARLLGLSRAHAYRLYARLRSGADAASPE